MQDLLFTLRRQFERSGITPPALGAAQQLIDVDVFRGQAGAQHIVRVGHDLETGAANVGVRRAGIQIHGFARLQCQHMQQQRGKQADVARVLLGQRENDGERFFISPALRGAE